MMSIDRMFELRDEKKEVIDATFPVASRKPEKLDLHNMRTLDLCDTGTAL